MCELREKLFDEAICASIGRDGFDQIKVMIIWKPVYNNVAGGEVISHDIFIQKFDVYDDLTHGFGYYVVAYRYLEACLNEDWEKANELKDVLEVCAGGNDERASIRNVLKEVLLYETIPECVEEHIRYQNQQRWDEVGELEPEGIGCWEVDTWG
jgi:hypothetical protein